MLISFSFCYLSEFIDNQYIVDYIVYILYLISGTKLSLNSDLDNKSKFSITELFTIETDVIYFQDKHLKTITKFLFSN